MGQRDRVRLTTSNAFVLEQKEEKNLYTYLSLSQYHYLRTPNYSEKLLLKRLEKDFKIYLTEMQKQVERDPNNHYLNRIFHFFSFHYQRVKLLRNEYNIEESITQNGE